MRDPALKTGDVLLQPAHGLIGRGITWFTGGICSHALIAWDERRVVDVTWPGGGRVRMREDIDTEFHIYRYTGELSGEQAWEIHQAIGRGADVEYDLPQFFYYVPMRLLRFIDWFRAPNRLNSRNRFICSELVQRAYRAAGIDVVPGVDPGDATPVDLADSPQLYRVW